MFVRFDYVQAAGRMMLKHPLTGTGWGDFLHDYSILRLWEDKEAPHSPHNMIMLFGSQCGIAGFLAALAVLAYPVVEACRQIRRTDWRDPKAFFALVPAFSCLILSVGTLLDIGFETTAYSGVLIAFSLLVLLRDAPRTEPFVCRKPFQWAAPILAVVFFLVALNVSYRLFRAEKAYSILVSELNPEYSFEHQNDPDYIPPLGRVQTLLKEAIMAAPDSPFPWSAGVDYMVCTGRLKEAMTLIGQAIERDPLQAAHYVKRARVGYLRDLVQLNALNLGGSDRLSVLSVNEDARRDLAVARRLAPKNPELKRPDADICRAAFTPKEPQP